MTDRAQSNVLGYVLLFGVVFLSITAATTLGFDALTSARDTSVSMNAELSMEGMASSVEDIRANNVSSRTSVFRMNSGTLEPDVETSVTVRVDGMAVISDARYRPIVYRFQDTEIIYSGGAIFRLQDGGQRIVRQPAYRFDSDTVILPVVRTVAADPSQSVGGSTSVVYLQRTGQELQDGAPTQASQVEVTMTTSQHQAELWRDLFEDQMASDACRRNDPADIGDGRYRIQCSYGSPTTDFDLILRQTRIRYDISS